MSEIIIIGGGLVGSLLGIVLSKDHSVRIVEQRSDPRIAANQGGRSINLVMTSRGLNALDQVGCKAQALAISKPVFGRLVHGQDGASAYQPYGHGGECNYSISRAAINQLLIDEAERRGVVLQFDTSLESIDFTQRQLVLRTGPSKQTVQPQVIFGCDGANSQVRRAMASTGQASDAKLLGHSYKELWIPLGPDGKPQLRMDALHIWPRGNIMLMALPNLDGSFTATLYLPDAGPDSFGAIAGAGVLAFFRKYFPDAVPLLPRLEEEMRDNPVGTLGTVQCAPWYHEDFALVLGDAAHAIVPFFGQGMNCGFEDAVALQRLSRANQDWGAIFAAFYDERKPNTDAVAAMSLENFAEMKEHVGNPHFRFKKQVEQAIEQRWPARYQSRYRLVTYTLTPYSKAYAVGKIQQAILDELCGGKDSIEQVDFGLAERLIRERLPS